MANVQREHLCLGGKRLYFEWDPVKDRENQDKHHVSFAKAMEVFCDSRSKRIIDTGHSEKEKRYYWVGALMDGGILTVRITMRGAVIRIIGAGYWDLGYRKYYEKKK